MDKDLSKPLFRQAGVTTADWLMAPATAAEVGSRIGFPVIVKPSKQGSTVGLSIVKEPGALQAAIDEAADFDDEVMIEQFIAGRELTVGILGGDALPVGEIIPKHEIYDYECKYTPGMAEEHSRRSSRRKRRRGFRTRHERRSPRSSSAGTRASISEWRATARSIVWRRTRFRA